MSNKIKIGGLLLTVCFLVWLGVGTASAVILNNGEYEVVVAVDPTMAHDANMITNIETMMKDASSYLHGALKEQARFSRVTILVPDSWPDDASYVAAEGETVAGADIFIGKNIGCGACAGPGRIQIDDGSMNGKTVVHEWGHYRFGLGDEYCDYVYKASNWYQVYKTSAGWNRCTALQDIVRDCDERVMTGASCSITTNDVNGAKASIMHRQGNAGIDSFCDDSTDDKYKHNSTVNNHQNRIWDNRSTWSAIEDHADGFKYSGGTTIVYSDPVFEVKKASKADIVLVIDVSGSMDSYSRIDNAARAAKNFVDRTEQGSYVAVVSFDDTAATEIGLTEITDEDSRTDVKDEVPTDDSGGTTSIGAGMQQAKALLDASDHELNKVMVLLTDGEENEDPRIADVLDSIVDANIKVYAVGLGAASDQQLQDVADQTGGVYYFAQDGDIQALNEAYTSAALLIASQPGNTLANETQNIVVDATNSFDAFIDSSLGQHTIFTFSGAALEMADIEVTLTEPDNYILNSTYSGYSRDNALGIIMFRIEGIAESGAWVAQVTNWGASSAEVNMEVTSYQAPYQAAVTLSAWLGKNSVTHPEPLAIFASLISTESIIAADVWAEVTPPSGSSVIFTLSDNGQGADQFPLDGTYSGFYTQYNGNGRYSVRVFADNLSAEAQLGAQFKDGPGVQSDQVTAMALEGNLLASDGSGMVARVMSNPAAELTENFERVTGAGAFELAGYVAGDIIEPNRILSLSVINTGQVPPAIVLGWIAPGDDMDNGTAASYDLRYSKTPITAATFVSAQQATGVGSPKEAGQEEQYTVLNLDCNTTYYFAIKAADNAGNTSEMSNVISGIIDDVTPPTIDSLSVNPTILWPPNHKMIPVQVDVSASDNCDTPVCTITYVSSDEPVNGLGDGDAEPDWDITGDLSLNLRSERSGLGDGRTYTITVTCVDFAGNTTDANAYVEVQHTGD